MHNDDQAWLHYREMFSSIYDDANYGGLLQAFAMKTSHKMIERYHGPNVIYPRVLEVGAGTGEHFQFVRHRFDEYIISDIDPLALEVAKHKIDENNVCAAKVTYSNVQGKILPYPDASFDRVIAVHVLEHISEPHIAIKEWLRVLSPGGVISFVIPTDPGIAWRIGRHLGPRKNAIAKGIAYDYVMAREHVNSCINLIALLRHYLPGARESWWPFPVPSVDLNLFFAFEATVGRSEEV